MATQAPTAPINPTNLLPHPDTPSPEHKSKPYRHHTIPWAHGSVRELIFGSATVKQHTIGKEEDEVQRIQVESVHHIDKVIAPTENASQKRMSAPEEPGSPSLQAHTLEQAVANGFGDIEGQSWDRPGHSRDTGAPSQSITETGDKESLEKGKSFKRHGETADSSYGWPGLGSWPERERRHERTGSQCGWPGLGSWSESK